MSCLSINNRFCKKEKEEDNSSQNSKIKKEAKNFVHDFNDSEVEVDCPLCMETLDLDDLGFFPCPCGYQICRFCWHRLTNQGDSLEIEFNGGSGSNSRGLCPACRQEYSDSPHYSGMTIEAMEEEVKNKKKKRKQKQKAKQQSQLLDCDINSRKDNNSSKDVNISKTTSLTTSTTTTTTMMMMQTNKDMKSKQLAGLRVVQKNLVFVIGLPMRLTQDDLRREFTKFGKIHKLVAANTVNGACNTAYVTFSKSEDAIKAIQSLNHLNDSSNNLQPYTHYGSLRETKGRGSTVKASLGTTKYCTHWLRSQQCPKLPDCMYLHELADPEASFTKDEMQQGKHTEYEKKLLQQYAAKSGGNSSNSNRISDNNDMINSCNQNGKSNDNTNHQNNRRGLSNHVNTLIVVNKGNTNGENNYSKNYNHQLNYHQRIHQNGKSAYSKTTDPNCNSGFSSSSNSSDSIRKLKSDEDHEDNEVAIEFIGSVSVENSTNPSSISSSTGTVTATTPVKSSGTGKIHLNILDEIIGSSNDSNGSTCYSTCSSGSLPSGSSGHLESGNQHRLANSDDSCYLKIESETFDGESLDVNVNGEGDEDMLIQHRDECSASPGSGTFDDDGLDFDPITISANGLEELMKNCNSSNCSSNSSNSTVDGLVGVSSSSVFVNSEIKSLIVTNRSHPNEPRHEQESLHQPKGMSQPMSHHQNPHPSPQDHLLWQNSLRSLLPNVNITFGGCSVTPPGLCSMSPTTNPMNSAHQQQCPTPFVRRQQHAYGFCNGLPVLSSNNGFLRPVTGLPANSSYTPQSSFSNSTSWFQKQQQQQNQNFQSQSRFFQNQYPTQQPTQTQSNMGMSVNFGQPNHLAVGGLMSTFQQQMSNMLSCNCVDGSVTSANTALSKSMSGSKLNHHGHVAVQQKQSPPPGFNNQMY